MATQSNLISGTGYGSPYIDSLVWGCRWTSAPIRYYFGEGPVLASESSIGAFTGDTWTEPEKTAFEIAIAQYQAVCNLTFTQANSVGAANADIVWWLANATSMGGVGNLGLHEVPDNSGSPISGYFNYQSSTWSDLSVGSYGYVTVIHELGHGLGLAHPHDGGSHSDATKFPGVKGPWTLGSYGLNQGIWTTMSYNDGWNLEPSPAENFGYQGTPMALDIAALQALYGANIHTATGNNIYVLPSQQASGTYWSCLWDAGGTDTISNAGSSLGATINLNAAPLVGANAGGFVSWNKGISGGYTIANGVDIENAVGGNGDDILIGNALANDLDGGLGIDRMSGGLGNDIYHVTRGDVVTEGAGAGGVDTVIASLSWVLSSRDIENLTLANDAGVANATGNGSANTLIGNNSSNVLNGDSGNDVLIGGGGSDRLLGGRGNDTFKYLAVTDSAVGIATRDVIADFMQGDLLDLSAIDANTNVGGNDQFTFVGAGAFTGAGQLRFTSNILSADLNGDGYVDFEIQLVGLKILNSGSLIL